MGMTKEHLLRVIALSGGSMDVSFSTYYKDKEHNRAIARLLTELVEEGKLYDMDIPNGLRFTLAGGAHV